jgi:chromosome partitioning protein
MPEMLLKVSQSGGAQRHHAWGTQALRVLALASQKGGSGKTTLSGHLAVQAQRSGAGPVVLIDIDPQGSLADWWNEREAEYPAFAQTTVARLANDLAVLRQQGFKLAVIDTPPAITMAIQSVISVAELIVVPTRPSPHDLRAVGATVDMCERAGKPLVFVVNAATPKAKITSEAAVALSQHGTVAPITLHHRTDFAASMIDGRTVMEVDPESRSAAEIAALWRYIADRLEKNFRRTVFSPAPNGAVQMGGVPRPAGGFGRRVAQ